MLISIHPVTSWHPSSDFAFCLTTARSLILCLRQSLYSCLPALRDGLTEQEERLRPFHKNSPSRHPLRATRLASLFLLQIHNSHFVRTARFTSCRLPSCSLRTAAVGSLSPFGLASLARRWGTPSSDNDSALHYVSFGRDSASLRTTFGSNSEKKKHFWT
jgi:hypothetical protein